MMPELPEVEHLRRHLHSGIQGATVTRVQLNRSDVVNPRGPGVKLRQSLEHQLLLGATITSLERHGKQLAIQAADGRVLCIHLGMSGRIRLVEPGDDHEPIEPHTHCTWSLGESRGAVEMRFVDPRRFGGLWPLDSRERLLATRWSKLGPDALTLEVANLAEQLAGRSRGLKAALLDQGIISGLGNIYVDEALFRAKLHPKQPAGTVKALEIQRLRDAVVGILGRAIEMGGSTVRTWVDSLGQEGSFTRTHQVYGRGGCVCMECGQLLLAEIIAQRQTVWCSQCQPLRLRKR